MSAEQTRLYTCCSFIGTMTGVDAGTGWNVKSLALCCKKNEFRSVSGFCLTHPALIESLLPDSQTLPEQEHVVILCQNLQGFRSQ